MGEAKRRKLAGLPPRGQLTLNLPEDLKRDIAKSVRSVELEIINDDAGLAGIASCLWRTWVGNLFLRTMLDIDSRIALGGVVYRVGPDPIRDVMAFCGKGNAGRIVDGVLLGHVFLEVGADIVDFSPGDWRDMGRPGSHNAISSLLGEHPLAAAEVKLGPLQWTITPPDFIWAPRAELSPVSGVGTPEIGKLFYTGWRGPAAQVTRMIRELPELADAKTIGAHFRKCRERYALQERVWAAREGHVFLDLRAAR